jgi:hypothetical protein
MATICKTCGGSYDPAQRGGTYLHACAPVVDKLIVTRAGALLTIAPATKLAGDVEVDRTYVERVNKVDETIAVTKG